MKKKIFSVFLVLCMVLTMLPFGGIVSFAESTIQANGFDIHMPTEDQNGYIWITDADITVGEVVNALKSTEPTVKSVTVETWSGAVVDDMSIVCQNEMTFKVVCTDGTVYEFNAWIAADLPSTDGYDGLCDDYYYNILSETEKTCEVAEYIGTSTNLTIPSQLDEYRVTQIGRAAFYYCEQLTDVIIPEGVISIEERGFEWCTALKSIQLPNSLQKIGIAAFQSCDSLYGVIVSNNVTEIGEYAFGYGEYMSGWHQPNVPITLYGRKGSAAERYVSENNTGDVNINVPSHLRFSALNSPSNTSDFECDFFNDGSCSVLSYTGSDVDIVIPSEINGYTVTNLGTGIWTSELSSPKTVKSITIPATVEGIWFSGTGLYELCGEKTENIYVSPENSTFCSIDGVLFSKDETSLYYYPKGKNSYGDYQIPNGVTEIFISAFENCTLLESVTIPDSVTSIYECAFAGCTSLKSITIPDGVTLIGWDAFNGCTLLTSITIPKSVTSIGERAFGFYPDDETYEYKKIEGFTIFGIKGSMAESYALENGFEFIAIQGIMGDINGDGTIDDWDSVLLDRYLAGWDVEINTSAADMDGNGIVDDWDGILLARKFAGWN